MVPKILTLTFVAILLSACNLSSTAQPAGASTPDIVSALKTQAVATVYTAAQTASVPTVTPTPVYHVYNPQPAPDDIFDAQGVPMRLVPAGQFTMGSDQGEPDEKPVHTVTLDAYSIDKYEVTNALYAVCVETGVCAAPAKIASNSRPNYYQDSQFAHYPVIQVNWDQARTYCAWREARLPSEAEWEKAARGTDQRTYPWGEGIDATRANYNPQVGDTTAVGQYPGGVSPYGLYDMAGNVSEWVNDWYQADYYATLDENAANPLGPASGEARVLRGGDWRSYESILRVSRRIRGTLESTNFDFGFRCAATLKSPQ
jgi:formylglycine-generating enzyme required for sulfatase activity